MRRILLDLVDYLWPNSKFMLKKDYSLKVGGQKGLGLMGPGLMGIGLMGLTK